MRILAHEIAAAIKEHARLICTLYLTENSLETSNNCLALSGSTRIINRKCMNALYSQQCRSNAP